MMHRSISRAVAVAALLVIGAGGCSSSNSRVLDSGSPASADATITDATQSSDPGATTEPPAKTDADTTTTAETEASAATASPNAGGDRDVPTALGDGPVTVITLGDSLTAGEGDETGIGFTGRLVDMIDKSPGRSGSSLNNLGASGWDSTMMVDGGNGSPAELGAAVDAAKAATDAGQAVLATVLIGSNDMWYLYEYGPPDGTPAENEDAAEATYRANLERTVRELGAAGAVVVLGLPDDQSIRPAVADIDRLHEYLPDVTVEEVQQMATFSVRLDSVTQDVAEQFGLRTVDTNDPFWGDEATMADDGIHPNPEGYAKLAGLWFEVIEELL
jgi:lysophospholipase L1-like esterase